MYKKILVLSLSFFLMVGICFADIEKVQTLLISGDLTAAEKECSAILMSNPANSIREQAQFYLAVINLKQNKYSEARTNFNNFIRDFPESNLLNRARLGVADSYFFAENYSLAEKIYLELLETKDKRIASQVYSRLMYLNLRQGMTDKAQDYLNKLHNEYPLSFEAGLIKELPKETKLEEIKKEMVSAEEQETALDFFTVQVGAFAEKDRADKLCQELIEKGEDACVVFLETPLGQSFYRVRVGRLATSSEAEDLAKKLSSQGYPTKVIP